MKKDRTILTTVIIGLCVILLLLLGQKFILPKDEILIRRTRNGHWRLLVKGVPSLIRGVVYNPIPIGQSHRYNFWADPQVPWIEDGRLMRRMGINTVRFFEPGEEPEQKRLSLAISNGNSGCSAATFSMARCRSTSCSRPARCSARPVWMAFVP